MKTNIRIGGGQNTYKINPLFKDIKEYNKYLLSLICIFILVLTGIISYNYTNTSYAKWNSSVESNNILKLSIKSNPNAPELTSNMIPVYYDATNEVWKKADSTNKNNKWYDYDNKMWANAVTVKANAYVPEVSTSNKSVSLSNVSRPATTFTSGGYNINNANSMTTITVSINAAGTFGFKATVSSESNCDKLTVTVTKNGGTATTVANAISGTNSNTYSDTAAVGDVYVITAKYKKDSSVNKNNDNGVLDTFTYPANTTVTYTDSSTAGGTSGQDWTASGLDETISFVTYGDSITYDDSSSKYKLNNTVSAAISSSLVGKYVCPTVTDTSCATPYKIVEASDTITKVDEYKAKTVARSTYLNASVGTEIPMDAINTMWVWIPRYTYTYLNTNTPEEIQIKFESGTNSTGTIKCTDAVTGISTTSETCTDSTNGSLVAGTSTYTHPAFTFGDTELTGIWVGKFENSASSIPTSTSTAESTIIIKPNVNSLRYKAVSYQFRDVRQMEKASNGYGFPQSSSTTFNWDGTLTGDTNNIDIHMMKNMEWGAVAYLSHSKYGINKEIAINSNSSFTTGCGPQSEGSTSSGSTCNAYNTALGQSASTTGNVYGVYDMSGGAYEYVMGNMVDSSGTFYSSSAGFSTAPDTKYYDKYSYGTSYTEYTRGKLGDATKEMAPTGTTGNWYSDFAYFPDSSISWFLRGGRCTYGSDAGAFNFFSLDGVAGSIYSSRTVISNQN